MKRKDPTHRAVQKKIALFLPEVEIEVPFQGLRRVADVVSFAKKIIFEVQYSPISLHEVQKRNRDYQSLGFTVVWILHDRVYNKKILSPVEFYLRQYPSYYTSITQFGHGIFYDQLEFFQAGQKIYQSSPFILKNFSPLSLPKIPRLFPIALKQKLKKFPFYFEGDLTHFLLNTTDTQWIRTLEKNSLQKFSTKKWVSNLFHSLLKKHSTVSDTF